MVAPCAEILVCAGRELPYRTALPVVEYVYEEPAYNPEPEYHPEPAYPEEQYYEPVYDEYPQDQYYEQAPMY